MNHTPFRIHLRRMFRRTPPQTEQGWTRCDGISLPVGGDPTRLVEFYNADDDSLCQVYAWSLTAYLGAPEAAQRYWREIPTDVDSSKRGFAYYLRSRTVLG